MTRAEHLAWCKERALEYLQVGDLENACASMGSDMSKHPETNIHPALMALGLHCVLNNDAHGLRRWIEGFN